MGDREEARALLKKSIDNLQMACDMMNTEPTYFNNLGLSQFEYENYDAALTSYETAIKLEQAKINLEKDRSRENLSFYHKNLGLAYYH